MRQERAKDPAGHSVPRPGAQDSDSLVSGSGGGRGAGGDCSGGSQTPSERPRGGGRGGTGLRSPGLVGLGGEVTVTAVPRRWRGVLRGLERGGGVICRPVRPSRAAGEDVTRQLWPQPRPPCRPPPRPSSRQHLCGPSGGAQQTAGPLAWGQRHRVSRAGQGGQVQLTHFKAICRGTPGPNILGEGGVGGATGSLRDHSLSLHSKTLVKTDQEAGTDCKGERPRSGQSPSATCHPAHKCSNFPQNR